MRSDTRGHGGFSRSLILFFSVIATILFLSPSSPAAQDQAVKIIDSTGVAVITGGNPVLARDGAIGDALRKAVEQAVGTFVSSDTMVDNYQVLSDSIYTRTQGYIRNYAIISEGEGQGLYQVTVRASVATGELMGDLDAIGMLQRKAERPRVLFMIAEKAIGGKAFIYWWWGKAEYKGEIIDMSAAEAALKKLFIDKGFSVVDASATKSVYEITDAYRVEDLAADGARLIGKELNAEVVVFGKAIAEEGPRTDGSRVGVYMADITAQAVRVDDGAMLASARGHGTARHISEITGGAEALSNASIDLGEQLISQITGKWAGPQSVVIRVVGITDYKTAADFKFVLKTRVRGIDAIYQRKFGGSEASFEVESKVPAQAIADDIVRIGGYQVMKTTPNTIDIMILDKK